MGGAAAQFSLHCRGTTSRALLALSLILLFSACTPSGSMPQLPPTQTQIAHEAHLLWANPLRRPSVIQNLNVNLAADRRSAHQLCVNLNQHFIWEPGDGLSGSEADTFRSVERTIRIEVDGALQNDLQLFQLLTAFIMGDQGSHGGNISACFAISPFSDGLHLGHISFQSTSGKQYAYEWAFRIVRTADTVNAQLPAALQGP